MKSGQVSSRRDGITPDPWTGQMSNWMPEATSPTTSLELRHFWTLHKHKLRLRHKVAYFPNHCKGNLVIETSQT